MEPFTAAVQDLMENHGDFQQKFKQRLVRESNNVINPVKFIAGLLTEGVLKDESTDSDIVEEYKEMMVQFAVKIASSQGAVGVGGLMKALEGSGNFQLLGALRNWAKEEFGVDIYGELREPTEGASALSCPATKKLPKIVKGSTQLSSIGRKLLDNITSRVEDNVIEQLQSHLVGKTSEIAHPEELCTSLTHHNVLEATDTLLEENLTETAIKVACSKKAIGSLILALESSNNERILVETLEWLQTSAVRKKNYPISVKSLARDQKRIATGLFAATSRGLISFDLQTLEATTLTSEITNAVAVNHKLTKVYWTQGSSNSSIMRSNFDGSNKEVIIPPTGEFLMTLTIEETSGNVYFTLCTSREIRACNALGQNCASVIFNLPLFNPSYPYSVALDSVKGFMYWKNSPSSGLHSLVRANLDGSNAAIISTEFNGISCITLDQPSSDVLYCVDNREHTIGTVDVNCGNKRTLVKPKGYRESYGIQVDGQKIYVCNNDIMGPKIQSLDKDSGLNLTTIFNSTTGFVYHLALRYTPVTQS